jgi:hypothetical protein
MSTETISIDEEGNTRARPSWHGVRAERNGPLGEMLSRIDDLEKLELDPPVTGSSWTRARALAWEIGDFISSRGMQRPDIFASHGEVSFEWHTHRTEEPIQAMLVLSADAQTMELSLMATGKNETLWGATRAAHEGARTFLLRLYAEIR